MWIYQIISLKLISHISLHSPTFEVFKYLSIYTVIYGLLSFVWKRIYRIMFEYNLTCGEKITINNLTLYNVKKIPLCFTILYFTKVNFFLYVMSYDNLINNNLNLRDYSWVPSLYSVLYIYFSKEILPLINYNVYS